MTSLSSTSWRLRYRYIDFSRERYRPMRVLEKYTERYVDKVCQRWKEKTFSALVRVRNK